MTADNAALLVIDMQVGLINIIYRGYDIVTRVAELLAKARENHIPIIYIQYDGKPDHFLAVQSPGWYIHPMISPMPGDCVIRKRTSNSFYQTNLLDCLQQKQIQHLVVTGCMTQFCIDSTCRHAINLNYDVTLVKDGHSTNDSDTLTAAQIIAHHNETLNNFGTDDHKILVKLAREIHF